MDGKYIKTSFESDWILINYRGIAVDEDGFPRVPDTYEFSQALYWYIIYKLMEGGFQHPAKINYLHAEERWLKYCGQARNDANMPSYAEAERLRDIWVSLLPVKIYDEEKVRPDGVDAKNLTVDTFQRYTVEE